MGEVTVLYPTSPNFYARPHEPAGITAAAALPAGSLAVAREMV